MRHKIPIAVCVGVMAASIAAVAYGDDDQPSPGKGYAQATTIDQRAKDTMAVLERARTAATDELPTDVAHAIDANATFGMNPALSRLAIGQATNSVYVVPGNGHICAALTAGNGATLACAPTENLANGMAGPSTKNLEGNAIAIFGMVPDGVDTVTVETGAATSAAIETSNNVYYTVVEAGTVLRSVSYTGPSGDVGWPIYDPSLAFDEQ